MKIATYNIWNSEQGMPHRNDQIVVEINKIDADIIGLQEVKDKAYAEKLYKDLRYDYYSFSAHDNENEGLVVFSKYPIKFSKYLDFGLIVIVEHQNKSLLLVNLHLPWDSILKKEKCIVNIIGEISKYDVNYQFIFGDFNASEESSVHQYLTGNRSLNGTEVKAYWTDLSLVAEEHLGTAREMTLDIVNNPRWKGQEVTDNSARVDMIFMHDCFPETYPTLSSLHYFGKDVDAVSGYSASDHYGVFVELKMPYET